MRIPLLGVCIVLLAGSCRHEASQRQHPKAGVESALERCVRAAGDIGDGTADSMPPETLAAMRACFAQYVKEPTVQRWAAKLPPTVTGEVLREGDRVFVDVLRQCAEQNGLAIDVHQGTGSAVRIQARYRADSALVTSGDSAFKACTEVAERAERSHLGAAGRPL